jgi:hypothetical protein
MSTYRTRYFVTYPGAAETEVGLVSWCKAERAAGFNGPAGHAATGGFSGHGISGRITYALEDETPEPAAARTPVVHELDIDRIQSIDGDPDPGELFDAIDAASDQDRITWLTDRTGKRLAAIVPVDVAEDHEQLVASVLPVIQHHRQPHGEITELLIPREHLSLDDPPDGESTPEQHAAARAEALRRGWPVIRHEFPREPMHDFLRDLRPDRYLFPGQVQRQFVLDRDKLRELYGDVPIDRKIPSTETGEEPS